MQAYDVDTLGAWWRPACASWRRHPSPQPAVSPQPAGAPFFAAKAVPAAQHLACSIEFLGGRPAASRPAHSGISTQHTQRSICSARAPAGATVCSRLRAASLPLQAARYWAAPSPRHQAPSRSCTQPATRHAWACAGGGGQHPELRQLAQLAWPAVARLRYATLQVTPPALPLQWDDCCTDTARRPDPQLEVRTSMCMCWGRLPPGACKASGMARPGAVPRCYSALAVT